MTGQSSRRIIFLHTTGIKGETWRCTVRGIGPTEILIVLAIVALLFGASRLPKIGNSLGKGLREFKNGITGSSSSFDEEEPKSKKSNRKDKDASGIQH